MKNSNENLKKRVYVHALKIIKFIDPIDKRDDSTKIICRQLLRSATSIGANIIEAQAGTSRKDFTNFYSYALKSANESKYWLGLLRDSGKVKSEEPNKLLKETSEIANILASSIITLRNKK